MTDPIAQEEKDSERTSIISIIRIVDRDVMNCAFLYDMGKKKQRLRVIVCHRTTNGGRFAVPLTRREQEGCVYESRVCVPFVTASLYVCLCPHLYRLCLLPFPSLYPFSFSFFPPQYRLASSYLALTHSPLPRPRSPTTVVCL